MPLNKETKPNSHQKIGTGAVGFRNRRASGDHPDYNIVEIGQNTEKSLEDFKRIAFTQIPVRKHQIMLVRKTFKGVNNNDSVLNMTLNSI